MGKLTRFLLPAVAICLFQAPGAAGAELTLVDLSYTPTAQTKVVNDVVEINIIATSAETILQDVGAIDAILDWDPSFLDLLGVDHSNAGYAWSAAGFLPDPDGINVDLTDGDALYTALAQAAVPAWAPPPPGLIVTTVQFLALAETPGTTVSFTPSLGQFGKTRVLEFEPPNSDVTGDTTSTATITIVPEPVTLMLLGLGAALAGGYRRREHV